MAINADLPTLDPEMVELWRRVLFRACGVKEAVATERLLGDSIKWPIKVATSDKPLRRSPLASAVSGSPANSAHLDAPSDVRLGLAQKGHA